MKYVSYGLIFFAVGENDQASASMNVRLSELNELRDILVSWDWNFSEELDKFLKKAEQMKDQ